MITISNHNTVFEMKFTNPLTRTRGYKVQAWSVQEVQNAIQHHYGKNNGGQDIGHTNGTAKDCPLCRRMLAE